MAENNTNLYVLKYQTKGDIAHEYQPLQTMVSAQGEIIPFRTDKIQSSLNNPVDIQCQPSYDGTVNLIINDDLNPPRIINNRFTKIENNRYEIKTRDQFMQTNLYEEEKVDAQTRLFRNINKIPKIDLYNVTYYGQLEGGNYTFYLKLADNDYNKTDVVAESGLISIFNGTMTDISSISGTLVDERTDKAMILNLKNIDTSFSYAYLYYKRETSDLNGVLISKTYSVNQPYKIKSSTLSICFNGYEEVTEIEQEELNIKYNVCTAVKTQAQVQNMLFFGNVQQTIVDNKNLQNLSYYIEVSCGRKEDSIGYVDSSYKKKLNDDADQTEYYNPLQIYYSLGYWPDEIYRLGVVYIFNDDSLSPVYNLRGCRFENLNTPNFEYKGQIKPEEESTNLYNYLKLSESEYNYLPKETFVGTEYLLNTKGVFKMPDYNVCNVKDEENKEIHPIYLKFKLPIDVKNELSNFNIKGLFFVRQKRIPITLAQGYTVGIDPNSYCPMLYENNKDYIFESFISKDRVLTTNYKDRKRTTNLSQSSGLLCLDANVNSQMQSLFDNSKFILELKSRYKTTASKSDLRHYVCEYDKELNTSLQNYGGVSSNLLYILSDIPLKYVNKYGFSTRVGSAEDTKQFGFIGQKDYSKDYKNIIRGVFCPFIGTQSILNDSSIYSIKINNYSSVYFDKYFEIRGNDLSPFMSISNRYELLDDFETTIDEKYITFPDIYRGDCYTNTVTIRIHTNFIDSEVPTNQIIVNPNTWKDGYKGYKETTADEWKDINRADINSVPIGTWVTYKCLSNYNLGLRAENRQNVEEMALMGNPRSFYPLSGLLTAPSGKVEESWLLNAGYSVTLPFKKYFTAPDVPYVKDIFDNRIMFSDVQIDDDFKNAYRIFQGLAYKDIERQYGAIVKLIPLGVNLFCVFEHGCAIIPINEKALISTNTGQAIHMYGAGVLQNQVTPISPDYGSIWQESIIRTPNGIYGVDTYAKKIWRFNEKDGFVLISDIKVQRFLNDSIELSELDKYPIIAARNVKTHYNNYKGDVMFTFYNKNRIWNLCFNERMGTWVTKYSWTPLYSENIDNIFYSLDQNRASLLGILWNNQNTNKGLRINNHNIPNSKPLNFSECGNVWNDETLDYEGDISYMGYNLSDKFKLQLRSITTSYIKDSREVFEKWTKHNDIDEFNSVIVNDNNTWVAKGISNNSQTNVLQLNKDIFRNRCYIKIDVKIVSEITVTDEDENKAISANSFYDSIVIVKNRRNLSDKDAQMYDKLLQNGFYVHGRAGIFDELDYLDLNQTNNILPTKWYNKQEPFEFEFVVNTPAGVHKIFDNLVMISNNVEPETLEFEIIGDVYDFNKAGLYKSEHANSDKFWNIDGNFDSVGYAKKKLDLEKATAKDGKYSQIFDKQQVEIEKDHVLNQYILKVKQPIKNIKTYGRRLGNIEYKEDRWFTTITPIYYKDRIVGTDSSTGLKSTRIRDKWIKIRIKYTGEKLVVINAIQSLLRLSYA